ncbi:MAG: hypothetical protein KGN76_12350 [Acidobacteriota bacterium]|nr:hypothetical protein [Acidobacteriota bacterium]
MPPSATDPRGGTGGDLPASLADVLEREHVHLGGAPPAEAAGQDEAARLRANAAARLQHGYAALCLSGGGIRSASFALGVIQGLAAHDLLRGFDYLSTVSGGGYTGGWLAGWLHHASTGPGTTPVFDALRGHEAGESAPEPEPVARVRANSRFMSPATGFFSADVWTLIATVARNLFLNWLVLVPLLAAALLLPVVYLGLLQDVYHTAVGGATDALTDPASLLFFASSALIVAGNVFAVLNLPSYGNRRSSQHGFLLFGLLPLSLGLVGLTLMVAASRRDDLSVATFAAAGAVVYGATWTAVGPLSSTRRWRPQTTLAGIVAGAVGAGGLAWLASLLKGVADRPRYAVMEFPLLVGGVLISAFVFMGVAGSDIDDDDLEWWSRAIAWFLIVAVGWLLVGLLVFEGPGVLRALSVALQAAFGLSPVHATGAIGIGTSGLGALAAYLGRSLKDGKPGGPTIVRRVVFAMAAPAFAVLLLASLAWLNEAAIDALHGGHALHHVLHEAVLLGTIYLVVGWLMGCVVPVNKFSLHGMYRNRLIRTFLGASRPAADRHPNPFTGFDPADDISLAALAAIARPFLVVNMTLNRVAEARRGSLHRKAESFTATPLHAGAPSLGYRPTAGYGGVPRLDRPGLSLGTAMTISGAAASPNMGAFSTPSLTFLLTLFNARLGTWLGNPGRAGRRTWRTAEPRQDAAPILREMLGLTTDRSPYVYLSDGGHFENLGLWEMVLRRCRFVLVSDAGCDPDYTFQDLATAIRQIRIDLGVPIVFDRGLGIDRAHQGQGNPHLAVGRILYREVDGGTAEDGVLVYVKATLCGGEPVDVLNYATSHPSFPHESTANQWFGEAQFESYRMLGFHSIHHVASTCGTDGHLPGFFRYLAQQTPATLAAPLQPHVV